MTATLPTHFAGFLAWKGLREHAIGARSNAAACLSEFLGDLHYRARPSQRISAARALVATFLCLGLQRARVAARFF